MPCQIGGAIFLFKEPFFLLPEVITEKYPTEGIALGSEYIRIRLIVAYPF